MIPRRLILPLLAALAVISTTAMAAESDRGLTLSEQVYDFGHVAIDFKLFHTFRLINNGGQPIRILGLDVSCNCSMVGLLDSLIEPGDSVPLPLRYDTKDLFGPTAKSFRVTTDDPNLPELQFFYKSIVGQWYNGLKPNPMSLFFLPGQKPRKVTILNRSFDEISLSIKEQSDTTFDIAVLKEKARRNQTLELEVRPRAVLSQGTYLSSFTIEVNTGNDKKPVILTVPVKMVIY